MRRFVGIGFFAAAMLFAGAPADSPAQQLYATGMRQTGEGNLGAARATFAMLLEAYPKDPLAFQAKGALDATLLFEEGQAKVKAGKYETARVAFDTLIAVYPENPLAERAQSVVQTLADKEKAAGRTVKAVEFRDFQALPMDEIRAAMDAREVRLSVGKPCGPKDIAQAKAALEEILAEKGVTNARVEAQTRTVPPGEVNVIFTVEKPRGSLLLQPWRLARAGWHRVRPPETPGSGL